MLVLLSDGDVATIWNEINSFYHTKLVIVNRECLRDDISNVVLQHPAKRLVVIRVKRLHILERDSLAQDALVDGSTEMAIQDTALVEGLANDPTNELEEHQMLLVDTTQLIGVEGSAI